MTQIRMLLGVGVLLASLMYGCVTVDAPVDVSIKPITQEVIKRRAVELPEGYDIESFGRLRLMLTDGEVQSNSSALTKQTKYMNTRFQSEMAKHKRFEINAVHGRAKGDETYGKLVDSGLIDDVREEDESTDGMYGSSPDVRLGWTMNIQESRKPTGRFSQNFEWRCTVNALAFYNRDIEDSDGKIKYKRGDIAMRYDFDLPPIVKKQELTFTGAVKSGFNYKSDADVQGLLQEIAIAASWHISEMLSRKRPVGGEIAGAIGTKIMMMDRGSDHGVEKGMQMVVFACYDGVDVALANAEASPAVEKTQLKIWRFADDDVAGLILKEIDGNPKRWMRETGCKLYAVRAVPPHDEFESSRFKE